MIRSLLLSIPAVRRQMERMSALESMVHDHEERLHVFSGRAVGVGIEKETLLNEIAARDQEIRLLKVSYGSTFEELAKAGKVGSGTPYLFEELLSIAAFGRRDETAAPPLVFIHVPKAGGTTLNNILMRNYRYRIDSYGDNFFPRYYPEEFVALVQRPTVDDTRRPVYFTGHITLDNDIFRYMPVRYVAITMLRDPVQRIVSHYRFHSMLPNSAVGAEINTGVLGLVDYFTRFRDTIALQYEQFAPHGSGDTKERVQGAINNLAKKVSLFGLQEDFDAFAILLQELVGLPDIFGRALNKTPSQAKSVTVDEAEKLRDLLSDDITFYNEAVRLYERRKQEVSFDFGVKLRSFAEAKKQYFTLRGEPDEHPWREFYA